MHDPHLQSLLVPLAELSRIPSDLRVLGIGIREAGPVLTDLPTADLTFVQGFRPDYLALAASGARVQPEMPDERFDIALVRLGRHRNQNEHWIADALRRLKVGGMLVCAGARTEGAARLRKRIFRLLPELRHRAMNHGEVFWCEVAKDTTTILGQIAPEPLPLIDGRFHVAAGMFSAAHIDPGSHLLAAHLPPELAGRIADFGAGWGYLAAELSQHCAGMKQLDLYEADFASLQAAKKNVPPRQGLKISHFWHDLLREPISASYDAIVTNPPFHVGRKSEPDIGRAILVRAAASLKPRGRLWLVANRQLPYEQVLAEHFSHHRQVLAADGYKILEARK